MSLDPPRGVPLDPPRGVPLDTTPRLADPDALFALLMEAHRDRTPEDSRKLDARLVLILANHIGDMDTLREAIRLAASTEAR